MKTKILNKDAVLKNINGLSEGDRAHCGLYGIITCTRSARHAQTKGVSGLKRGVRLFKVSNSKTLRNGGNWTMAKLRKAIVG